MVSVCIAGATHNPMLLDRRGEVLRPSIHFWDRRSQAQVADIQARWGAGILAGVGAGLFPSEAPAPRASVPVEHELRPGPDVDIYETSYRSYLKVEEQLAAIDSPSR